MKQLSILFRGTLGFPFPVSGAFALCLLLLASCGGDDSSDEGYAAIESASFTFDETTPANNAVRVIANTGWQVFWTPESAAVRVEPASGSGNGVFYVWDMPKGASVQVGVRAASGKTSGKPVTVTRAADAVGVTLSVAPAELRSGLARIERRHRDDERFVESGMSQFRAEVLARLGYGQRHDHHCRRARGAAHHADRYGRRRLRRQDCNLRDRAQSGDPRRDGFQSRFRQRSGRRLGGCESGVENPDRHGSLDGDLCREQCPYQQ